tara:strand:- start:1607 stop:1834 length:228 start_codon:yes stop_codon:yes gene_type:complete
MDKGKMIQVNKIYPALCKLASCLDRADYEFTDAKTIKTKQEDGLVKEEIKTVTLGHACNNHVVEVNKMLQDIHKS